MDEADELICLGYDEDHSARMGAMMPPIYQTSLFSSERLEGLMAGLASEHTNYVYSRGCNPTVEVLERKLAALEGGQNARCFASGMGAVSAVLMGLLSAGDHVLFVNNIYGPTLQLATYLKKFGVNHDCLADWDPQKARELVGPSTRIIYFESPGTMLFNQVDIPALVAFARERGLITVIDNTWATPLFQKPLRMGVDIAIHSCSKYIGGHSDTMGGMVIGSVTHLKQIFYNAYLLNGANCAPIDAFLLIRGLRSLPTRLRQHHEDGLVVAQYLAAHPQVARVFHPALLEAAQPLKQRQLTGYSGLFSFQLKTENYEAIAGFVNALSLFRIGVSWGGVESLVITPNRGDNAAQLAAAGLPAGLVRLSVGLEGAQPLIKDLALAFKGLERAS